MAVTYITVKGTYLLPDGVTPNAGYIEFRPNVTLTAAGIGVILPDTLQAVLDVHGYFEIELLATDNSLIAPVGWLWQVDEKIKNGNRWYLQTKSVANGGLDPLDIANVYSSGIENPPTVVELPAPAPTLIVGFPSRVYTNLWTGGSIAPGVNIKGFGSFAASYRMYSISTDAPCRLRMYTTAAKRDADLSRAIGTDPTGDHGLILEFVSTSTTLSADLSPMVDGFTGSDGVVYYTITNTGASAASISANIIWIRAE